MFLCQYAIFLCQNIISIWHYFMFNVCTHTHVTHVNMLCFMSLFYVYLYLRYISLSLWYVYMIVNICVVHGHQSDVWQKIFPICGISYFYFTHRHTTLPHRDIILLDMFLDKVTLPLKLPVQLKICLCLILISHLDRPNFWLSDFTNSSHKTC